MNQQEKPLDGESGLALKQIKRGARTVADMAKFFITDLVPNAPNAIRGRESQESIPQGHLATSVQVTEIPVAEKDFISQ